MAAILAALAALVCMERVAWGAGAVPRPEPRVAHRVETSPVHGPPQSTAGSAQGERTHVPREATPGPIGAETPRAAPAAEASELPSTCSPAALSAYNYEVARKYLEHRPPPTPGPGMAAPAPAPHLLVSGRVSGDQWALLPLQTVWTPPAAGGDGAFRLTLVSEAGAVTEVSFEPRAVEGLPGVSVFTLLVPDPGPLARVELSDGKKRLWEKRAVTPARAGEEDLVQLEESGDALQLSWDAAAFPYALVTHLSDGRRTTLAVGLEGGAASLTKGNLPDDGLFEVSLSDGVRTTARYFPRR